MDCGVNTSEANEYYMLHNHIWNAISKTKGGMLCIGCAEKRLGRRLTAADFSVCELNRSPSTQRSARLLNRMGNFQDVQ
jgi:hypothetical protein